MILESEDLAHISYGGTLGTVLSGFNRLLGGTGGVSSNIQTLVVFVVGGVTAREVRELKEVAKEKGVQVS